MTHSVGLCSFAILLDSLHELQGKDCYSNNVSKFTHSNWITLCYYSSPKQRLLHRYILLSFLYTCYRLGVSKPNHFFVNLILDTLDTFDHQKLMKIDKNYFVLYYDSFMTYLSLFYELTSIFILK